MGTEKTSEDRWYVLRDLARPNAKKPAYKQLQEMPEMADCVFVPLKQHVFKEFGKPVVRFVPYMPDLVFVHKSKQELDPIVREMPLLQYRYVRGGKQYEAMSVRHKDFEKFRDAVNTANNNVEYYSFDEVRPEIYGSRIRIIGGRLDGFEGRLMTKKGSKFKRLLIDLQECNLSAAILVESDFIQVLDKPSKWVYQPATYGTWSNGTSSIPESLNFCNGSLQKFQLHSPVSFFGWKVIGIGMYNICGRFAISNQ